MRFLGGLLKFFSILLMLVATVVCTVVIVMEGVIEGYEEAIWVMSGVWVVSILFCLNILGTGIALSQVAKLKKRVNLLEQRPAPVAVAPVVETPKPVQPVAEAPVVFEQQAEVAQPQFEKPVPPTKKSKKWVPIAIVAAVAVLAVVVVLVIGGNKPEQNPQMQNPEDTQPTVNRPVEEAPAPTEAPEQDNATHLSLGDVIDNELFMMSFDSVEILEEFSYRTSEYSTTSLYVEEGYKLLLVKGHFENRHTAAISDSMFAKTATVNGTYMVDGFDVHLDFLRSKSFEIDPYTDLDFVLHINIPEKLAEMYETVTFTLGYNGDLSIPTTTWHPDGTKTTDTEFLFALDCGTAGEGSTPETTPAEEPVNTISIGQTVVTADYEFTLKNVELTYEVLPPNTSSVYTSYTAESGKVYVHVEADVKNIMQRDLRIDELFTSSVLYDGKYPYTGFQVVNDGDNRFDWVGSYVAATPLETCKAHSLIECPVEVDTSGKSIVVKLTIGDQVYEYVLR